MRLWRDEGKGFRKRRHEPVCGCCWKSIGGRSACKRFLFGNKVRGRRIYYYGVFDKIVWYEEDFESYTIIENQPYQ